MRIRFDDFDKKPGCIEIVTFLLIALIIIIIAAMITDAIINENKKISEGIIIEKYFYPGDLRSTGKYAYIQKDMYEFTIQGEKNGETVEYNFAVTPYEYEKYKVGDYYKK